ncbi:SgcJ/EcaC family oxidoreductase [Virgibacillus senegalensis]|uniref:SgcJ/EcaC family oxidoreductase n=1 Tax=Virgibacillus senegalensis TaxID=1499679 RepID=UPI00069D6492|nr:SgcJ/EcaC family oxidoreductase [Virgibacillus senegalensis]
MSKDKQMVIEAVYNQLITAWNERNASGMAELFNEFGELIGFDGSLAKGPKEIFDHLSPIFRDHPTPPFVCKVKSVRFLSDNTVILRAIAGMIPPGQQTINPEVNTHHTLVTVKENDSWKIELFQNTPAQFHGRPELVDQMTNELNELH